MHSFGKILILIGAIFLFAGIVLMFLPKLNFFGKLPGDIEIRKQNFTFYFPIVTSIVISIILTFIFWLINFFTRK
jgi:hypothetical protein